MTEVAVANINAALADPDTAREHVADAGTALDAVTGAGIEIDDVERDFLRAIPDSVWTALKGAILDAYNAGQNVTFKLGSGETFALDPPEETAGGVILTLSGPLPQR